MPQAARNFPQFLDLHVRDVPAHPEALEQLRHGQLAGIIVREVLPVDLMSRLVDRLAKHDPPFIATSFPPEFRSGFYGWALDLAQPDLEEYFSHSAGFKNHLDDFLPQEFGLESYLIPLLSALHRGWVVESPPGPQPGHRYMPTTLRHHEPGGYIPPHCEHEQLLRPAYWHLKTLVKPPVFSFVLAFSLADSGGALEIYDKRFEELEDKHMRGHRTDISGLVDELASIRIRIGPGTLVLFDGGRHMHRLTPVEGRQVRWTMSSFMAASRDDEKIFCWG